MPSWRNRNKFTYGECDKVSIRISYMLRCESMIWCFDT